MTNSEMIWNLKFLVEVYKDLGNQYNEEKEPLASAVYGSCRRDLESILYNLTNEKESVCQTNCN
jgi:hypothetical protein